MKKPRGRITIPAVAVEFDVGGNTIWVHGPDGGTVLRIKVSGRLGVDRCDSSPVSHLDLIATLPKDPVFCLAPRLSPSSPPSPTKRRNLRVEAGEAAVCPSCRRVIGIQIPRGGDGSAKVFYTHGSEGQGGRRCRESRQPAPGWGLGGDA